MADRLATPATGGIDSHPDFPEFFRQAQEEVFGEFSPRIEQALTSGNTGAFERLSAEIDRRARQRAVVATRAMLNFASGQGGSMFGRPYSAGTPTLSGAENQPGAPPALEAAPASAPPPMQQITGDLPPPQTLTGAPVTTSAPSPVGFMDNPSWGPAETPMADVDASDAGIIERFARPSAGMIARPLMPQSPLEEQDQRTANERLATVYRVGALAGLSAVPTASGIGAGLATARGVGNVLASRIPFTGGVPLSVPLGAAGALAATTTEASPPTPQEQARKTQEDIDKLRANQAKQTAARDAAEAAEREFQQRFGSVGPGSSRAEILALQQFLASPQGFGLYSVDQRGRPVRPDGVWANRDGSTSGTQMAMQAYLKRLADDRAAAERRAAEIGGEITPLQSQLRRYEANAATAASEANMSPLHRFVRDWVPPLAGVAGSLFGVGTRAGMRYLGDRASRRVATEADASLAGAAGGDASARVGAINQYYTRGGGEAPFAVVPGAPAGFVSRGGQSSMDLYQSGSPWMRGGDWGRTAGFAGAGALAAGRYFGVDREAVEDARRRYNENPTQENANALRRAEYIAAASQSGMAFGFGGAMSYPAASAAMRYRSPRPDLGRAEAEVMSLNAVARGRNNQLPAVDYRRRNPNPDAEGGHWVRPDAPAPAPGAGPAWASPNAQQIYVSPSGENVVYSTTDAQGRVRWWRRLRGGPAEPFNGPPRTYRRVAEAAGDGGSSVG